AVEEVHWIVRRELELLIAQDQLPRAGPELPGQRREGAPRNHGPVENGVLARQQERAGQVPSGRGDGVEVRTIRPELLALVDLLVVLELERGGAGEPGQLRAPSIAVAVRLLRREELEPVRGPGGRPSPRARAKVLVAEGAVHRHLEALQEIEVG